VPLKTALCGLPAAFDAMLSAPLRTPGAMGMNATLIVHVARGASVAPQVFVCPKSPDVAMLVMSSVAPPVFCKVSACDAEIVPTSRLPKPSEPGLNDTAGPGGAAEPVPVSDDACGLP